MKALDLPPSNLSRLRSLTEELTHEETELCLFFKLTPDLFYLADSNGLFRKVNDAWVRILGWSEEKLLSCHIREFIHPDDICHTEDVLEHMTDRNVIRFYNRFRKSDGGYVVLEWSAAKCADGLTYAAGRTVPKDYAAKKISESL